MSLIVAAALPPLKATVFVADGRQTGRGERGSCGHHQVVESETVRKLWRDSGSSIYGPVGNVEYVDELVRAACLEGYAGLVKDFADFFGRNPGAPAAVLVAEGPRIAKLDSGVARINGELEEGTQAQRRYGELMTRSVRDRNGARVRFAAAGCGEAHFRKDRICPDGLDANSLYNSLTALAETVERVSGVCCGVGKPYFAGFSIDGELAVILPIPEALEYAKGLPLSGTRLCVTSPLCV